MTKVFISYGEEDRDKAIRLYDMLEAITGIQPWLDKKCLPPGIKWRPAIRKAIRESDYFMLLLSRSSVQRRGFIHQEIDTAINIMREFPSNQTFLIPVRLDDCQLPTEELNDIQYVNFFPEWEQGFQNVIDVISKSRNQVAIKTTSEDQVHRYQFKVGLVDLDIGITKLHAIAKKLNSIQQYFCFELRNLPSCNASVQEIDGYKNLAVFAIPSAIFSEHKNLDVDFVACLTQYPLVFMENGSLQYNYFSGPSDVDNRFMFISTDQLKNFTKAADCTFEKGIVYIIASQLVVYFTNLGYHDSTDECLMDFCGNRADIVKGLQKVRFCKQCLPNIIDNVVYEPIKAILSEKFDLKITSKENNSPTHSIAVDKKRDEKKVYHKMVLIKATKITKSGIKPIHLNLW